MLWALSIGRYIVVFTELIVILSFLSRFKLDRELTDLNEAIARQKAIILSYGTLEEDIRFTQAQLALVRQTQTGVNPIKTINLLSRTMPTDVRLEKFSLTDTAFQISGTALSPQGFVSLINNLNLDPTVSEINVGKLSSQDEGHTITFDLTTTFKQASASAQRS